VTAQLSTSMYVATVSQTVTLDTLYATGIIGKDFSNSAPSVWKSM